MTDVEMRVAISEACGWTECRYTGLSVQGIPPENIHGDRPAPSPNESDNRQWYWLPDFVDDLNAMREAEKTLGNKSFDYNKQLKDVAFKDARVCDFSSYPGDFTWHATAKQRAEAFLRTIGKWKD